ncbi:YdiU family protein [Nitrospira defluvii]|nr:YdiU family protein [Nitrospira defluvii]
MERKKVGPTVSQSAKCRPRYALFSKIDGTHPYKKKVVDGYIDYPVHYRYGGEIFYFNFQLAKEMGLIAQNHAAILNKDLIDTLLYTFSIEISNEYDQDHKTHFPEKEMRPHPYMATRYLQQQHPNKQGITSGDGRSIWNGCFKWKGAIWDISSCGTGATALSPATAIEGRFFKTGDEDVSYGGGRAELDMGLSAAINSEIFHHSGIETERILAIVLYPDGSAVNVRVAKNLLRPAHLFRYLKQNNYEGLKDIVDYYIERQIANHLWPRGLSKKQNYRYLLQNTTETFARLSAEFESSYIFCWLDWDGDNILMDGGIIDYGSIRQFGLFHREYRYDDYDRMSTTILGQKHQAKYIVQTFAQAVDFLLTGKKKPIKKFRIDRSVKDFDRCFKEYKEKSLLYRMGFERSQVEAFFPDHEFQKMLRAFMKEFSYFERVQSSNGVYKITDGVCSDAVFCMRDVLRELPMRYLQGDAIVADDDFIEILKSKYAKNRDARLYGSRKRKIRRFQHDYKQLIHRAAELAGKSIHDILKLISERSTLINRYERVTGDAVIRVADKMIKVNKNFGANEMVRIFRNFVEAEILVPEYFDKNSVRSLPLKKTKSKKALRSMTEIVKKSRWGI